MKITATISILLFSVATAISGCKHAASPQQPNIPAGMLGKFNNVSWTATVDSAKIIYTILGSSAKPFLFIFGSDSVYNGNIELIQMVLEYPVITGIYYGGPSIVYRYNSLWSTPASNIQGTLNITQISANNVQGIFNFTDDTLKITGQFNLPIK